MHLFFLYKSLGFVCEGGQCLLLVVLFGFGSCSFQLCYYFKYGSVWYISILCLTEIVVDCCFLVYIFFDLLINIFGCNLTNLTMSSIHLSQLWAGRDSCCSWCLIFYIGWLSLFLRFVCQLLRSMYNNLKQHPRYLCFKVIDLLETCIVHFPC